MRALNNRARIVAFLVVVAIPSPAPALPECLPATFGCPRTSVITQIWCTEEPVTALTGGDQEPACEGYDGTGATPYGVRRYMHAIVSVPPGAADLTAVVLYISPSGGSQPPEWVPASIALHQGEGPFTVMNADTTSFPLLTRKCAHETSPGSREFRAYVEMTDAEGAVYRTSNLTVRIPLGEHTNPPVCI